MDFLKDLLTEENYTVVKGIVDEYNASAEEDKRIKLANLASGQYVNKDRHEGELGRSQKEVEDLKEQLNKLTKSLEDAQKSAKSTDDWDAKIKEIQESNAAEIEKIEANAKKDALDYEVRLALMASGAKDEVSTKAHLDMEKIEIGKDGKLTGLNDQIESLRKSHDYLFGEAKSTFKTEAVNPPPAEENLSASKWHADYKKAIESGKTGDAIRIKNLAYEEDGVIIN